MTPLAIKILGAQVMRNTYEALANASPVCPLPVAIDLVESCGREWLRSVRHAENSKR